MNVIVMSEASCFLFSFLSDTIILTELIVKPKTSSFGVGKNRDLSAWTVTLNDFNSEIVSVMLVKHFFLYAP